MPYKFSDVFVGANHHSHSLVIKLSHWLKSHTCCSIYCFIDVAHIFVNKFEFNPAHFSLCNTGKDFCGDALMRMWVVPRELPIEFFYLRRPECHTRLAPISQRSLRQLVTPPTCQVRDLWPAGSLIAIAHVKCKPDDGLLIDAIPLLCWGSFWDTNKSADALISENIFDNFNWIIQIQELLIIEGSHKNAQIFTIALEK